MRFALVTIGLEAYALILAGVQALGGVRTDEAKYLIDIPYPHPPLARAIISFNEFCPYQDLFWRMILATLVIQAVWLVWNVAKKLKLTDRIAACGFWLIAASVVLQAGSIMMAPLTALQALLFLWLLLRNKPNDRIAGLIGLLWFASLLSAYQIVLYLPVVYAIYRKMNIPRWQRTLYFFVPPLITALYAFANPLILASMFLAGAQNVGLTPFESIEKMIGLWAIGGSVLVSALATISMVRKRRWPLLLSFALVVCYTTLSFRPYYAILFTPLFVMALVTDFKLISDIPRRMASLGALVLVAVITSLFVMSTGYGTSTKLAESTIKTLNLTEEGELFISGSFGHEWQYFSTVPVRRYGPGRLDGAQAVVCLEECTGIPRSWSSVEGAPVTVYTPTR